ncbi:hypothetical protein BGZ98_003568, partial [Dissophora globulifera]
GMDLSSRRRCGRSDPESPLIFTYLKDKWRRLLVKKDRTQITAFIIIDSSKLRHKRKAFSTVQDRYIKWAAALGADAMGPQLAVIK